MKLPNNWTLPVSVSLLLHTGLFVFVTYIVPATSPAANQSQAITVELYRPDTAPARKPLPKTVTPKDYKKPKQDSDKSIAPIALTLAAEATHTAPIMPVEISTENQPDNPAAESQQPRLNIQPISKLSRLPSFLQKIEPVYPSSEQRAGSQAYVLAEVTIDETGMVQNVKIAQSAGITFDNAVIYALKKSIFVPGYIGQKAVAVRVMVPIRFNLR